MKRYGRAFWSGAALALSLALFTGTALAKGPPGGTPPGQDGSPGKSGKAPGKPANAGKPASPGKSAQAPGRTKAPGTAASPTRGKSAQAPRGKAKGPANKVGKAGGPSVKTAHQKITICHATGSETNPFVEITISINATKKKKTGAPSGHGKHEDDIIPAPATGCPTGPSGGAVSAGVTGQPTAAVTAAGGVAGAQAVLKRPAAKKPAGGILGRAAGLKAAVTRGRLPFTGLPLWVAVLAGAALLATGLTARRFVRARTNVDV